MDACFSYGTERIAILSGFPEARNLSAWPTAAFDLSLFIWALPTKDAVRDSNY